VNAPQRRFISAKSGDIVADPAARSVVFLVSDSRHPCGVEMFERELARATEAQGMVASRLEVGRRWFDAWTLWRGLAHAHALVVSLPVVAWKKAFLTPLLALVLARLRGARTIVVLHEWSDLNPMRRAIVSLYLLFAKAILISSPRVRADFESSAAGRLGIDNWLVPIPPNIAPPRNRLSTDTVERLRAEKASGRIIVGQFGSIYPKKQSDFVLDVASAAKAQGLNAFVVFIGGFIKGSDDVEARFRSRVMELGLEDRILVTGYVETEAEIFSLFDAVDVFVYSFSEGLTSRRGSVLACLQSGRPVVVNAPANENEFDHHPVFKRLIDEGALQFVPTDASQAEFAAAIARIAGYRASTVPEIFIEAWRDAAAALRSALR